jgi:general secretion pathway protein N
MRSQLCKNLGLASAGLVFAGGLVWLCLDDARASGRDRPLVFGALEGRQAPLPADAEPAAAQPSGGPATEAPAAVPTAQRRRESGNPLWAVPLRSLSATRDRPLFSPARRPPAPAVAVAPIVETPAPAPAAAPERPSLALVGTIIGQGTDKIAIFFNANTRSVIRLHLGESDGGWVLRSVGTREIVLEKNGKTFILALPAPGDAPAQPTPSSDEQL